MTNDDRDIAPPAIGLRLLDRVICPDVRDAIVGDLVERYRRDAIERGLAAARLRFWWEALVAVRHFGSLAGLRRERHQENLMSSFLADLRHAARLLRRAPGFAALCAVTLALAIGPTTAIFSVVDPLLIRSLPYDHPDRLVYLWERDQNGHQITTGFATVQDIRASATTLESVSAVSSWIPTLSDPSAPERLNGSRVTWNYFRTLGVHPMLGRDFVADEDKPIQPTSFGGAKVVLLSFGLWTRRFAADSSIVGHPIQLGGTPWTVIGVLPKSYEDVHQSDAQIYAPLGYAVGQPWACRSCRHLTAIARIRDGVPRQRAKAELDQISSQIVAAYPKEYSAAGMFVQPMQEEVTRAVRPALYAIAGAVVLVLLIAVANVVNLQLARAVRRDAEFGVRLALGAGAARLAQQLAAEGLVIAAAGGALGIALGWATLPLLVARLPRSFPRIDAIHFDLAALAVVVAIVVPLAIVLGVVPARGARKASAVLRRAARREPRSRRGPSSHAIDTRDRRDGARAAVARERRAPGPQPRSIAGGRPRVRSEQPHHHAGGGVRAAIRRQRRGARPPPAHDRRGARRAGRDRRGGDDVSPPRREPRSVQHHRAGQTARQSRVGSVRDGLSRRRRLFEGDADSPARGPRFHRAGCARHVVVRRHHQSGAREDALG